MFDDDHPLLSTASLTALILHAADVGPVTLETCSDRLDRLFEQADKTPGLSLEERRAEVARHLHQLTIARILEPADTEGGLRLTDRGREALQRHPDGLDQTILATYPEYAEYLQATAHHSAGMDPRIGSYDEGFSARLEGQPFDANPYSPNSVDHQTWKNGWAQANEKERQAARFRPVSEG